MYLSIELSVSPSVFVQFVWNWRHHDVLWRPRFYRASSHVSTGLHTVEITKPSACSPLTTTVDDMNAA